MVIHRLSTRENGSMREAEVKVRVEFTDGYQKRFTEAVCRQYYKQAAGQGEKGKRTNRGKESA